MKRITSFVGQSHNTVEFYDTNAHELATKYEALTFEQVHSPILKFLPTSPARILDVGAGTGRDASALAMRGHDVVAAEPSRAFREIGKQVHPSSRIAWMDDRLPALEQVLAMGSTFDAILSSAVWMHLDGRAQTYAMQVLANLLIDSGRLFVTFRTPLQSDQPSVFDTLTRDVAGQALAAGLHVLEISTMQDFFQRPGVVWHSISLEKMGVE